MAEKEIIEFLQSCRPLSYNLKMNRLYRLTPQDITCLQRFKSIWEDIRLDPHSLIAQAGMSDYEFAFLGGYLYTFDLLYGNKI